ncbi:MAG: hypothetical protein RMM58_13920 [Chloroflexota bacterium]|nr:hypothetical protein [Chloroflexota bacterium]
MDDVGDVAAGLAMTRWRRWRLLLHGIRAAAPAPVPRNDEAAPLAAAALGAGAPDVRLPARDDGMVLLAAVARAIGEDGRSNISSR